jgi:hypothetical protein
VNSRTEEATENRHQQWWIHNLRRQHRPISDPSPGREYRSRAFETSRGPRDVLVLGHCCRTRPRTQREPIPYALNAT